MNSPSEFDATPERRALYDKYWAEAQTRQRSSLENFDKSILAYSSSGLGISLAFLKDFVPMTDAISPWLLYFSWLCFVLATTLTIASFLISYKAQELSVNFAEEYLLNGRENFRNKTTWRDGFLKYSNLVSGMAFVSALGATSIFVMVNLNERTEMTDKRHIANDGMPTAIMQKAPAEQVSKRGLPTASIPAAPAAAPAAAAPKPTSNSESVPQKANN